MSNGTITPPPAPTPAQQPKTLNWAVLISSIVAALLAGHNITPVINPPKPPEPTVVVVEPPKPTPNPTPVVVPPVVVPPRPVPDPGPTPTPIIPPGPIVNGVSILDARGKALGNTVNPGRQFTITAPTGWVLTAVPTIDDDGDINDSFGDNVLVCTLRNGCRLDVYVKNPDVRRPTIFQVQCNQAPQPPPVVIVDPPKPTPTPEPTPNPVPVPDDGKTGKVRVLVLTDPNQALSRDQINAIASPIVTDLLNTKCVKASDGRPAWHKWDKTADVSSLPEWTSLMAACNDQIAKKSVKLPVLCIENGNSLEICEITNEASILNPLNAAFGS